MEVMAEVPPPLPPKTKKAFGPRREEPKTVGHGTSISIAHQADVGSLKVVNDRRRDGVAAAKIPQATREPSAGDGESRSSVAGPKIITWGSTVAPPAEDLYENVSNGGVNYLESRLKNIASDGRGSGGKRKTPKIEVRQEENKTVVKISIKEAPTPEEETGGEEPGGGVYENGHLGANGFEGVEYENARASGEGGAWRENPSDGCYENVEPGERPYANVSENVGCHGRPPKKELITEANYGNLNGDDSRCDQVYRNRETQISKSNVVSIISKNASPAVTGSFKRDDGDDDLYENVKTCEKARESGEKRDGEKKSSLVEVLSPKPSPRPEKPEAEYADDASSGDPFDSGTCSDVDSLPNCAQNRKVIVTIKSLGEEKDKKVESGHKRAESLTSSGLGVDSEESDDEKSNISCDSLNSNDQYPQSNSEDHGYHTPNSEDKTGSPVDRIEYENAMETADDGSDIIRRVANVSQKIKHLRMESGGLYAAKPIDPSELQDYENVYAFGAPKPREKAPEGGDGKKTLPKSLLRDIRSRNVRLSSTCPAGEKQESGKVSVASVAFDLEGGAAGKRQRAPRGRQPVVEERTYEERKTDARGAKTNRICAMEVDTDKFYKFHLAENVRDGGKENGGEEETFAGVKDYLCREKPAAITSAKGTIRGVKNRVKAGIATFLQLHENKSYKDRDAGKVVVYTTTMGIVRETYHKCLKVKQILRTLMVKFEERDVFMSSEAQDEIRERMKCNAILVPQVFVEGQHIGDAETIERLNEMGELRTILKPYKSADACSTCKVCGGYRLLPCSVCKGSKKSIHRNHFTAEFVALKCMNCDQVGLTKCHAC